MSDDAVEAERPPECPHPDCGSEAGFTLQQARMVGRKPDDQLLAWVCVSCGLQVLVRRVPEAERVVAVDTGGRTGS